MVLLEQLRIHVGGLVLLKTELFWYGDRGWDRITDRTVLLMDSVLTYDGAPWVLAARTRYADVDHDGFGDAACLLIDGRPHWVWIAPADVELL